MNKFGWDEFLYRFIGALVIVFATYNPEGYSYYHWLAEDWQAITALKAFVGVTLLIGWVILLRATLGSLGFIGLALAIAFFGLGIWLLVDLMALDLTNSKVISYIIEVVMSFVLSIGVSWSHVRRRLSGQIDSDEIEQL
ncbi:MAG: hypothetical protein ISR69_02605 [Gammaproteobacteria bacterium]|nr:hypothetical protein [Gammaproteobacteria bacterium]